MPGGPKGRDLSGVQVDLQYREKQRKHGRDQDQQR